MASSSLPHMTELSELLSSHACVCITCMHRNQSNPLLSDHTATVIYVIEREIVRGFHLDKEQ